MTEQTITIEDGRLVFVWDDALADLVDEGVAHVERVSNVEPHPDGGWTADMSPVGGPVLDDHGQPFRFRRDALDAERVWLTTNLGL